MKVLLRSVVFSAFTGICMYIIDVIYNQNQTQAAIKELEQHPLANIIQYFPETFHFYLITDNLWLDILIVVSFSFLLFLFGTLIQNKYKRN
ncbi:hypothetical protein [Paenibacillus gansuensis]|uniref:DUF4306 domain-containing protein n=1 Tax=Paenibacillus gansuensis TaxID=306542 RepID=A0ABW5P9W3_9BACL